MWELKTWVEALNGLNLVDMLTKAPQPDVNSNTTVEGREPGPGPGPGCASSVMASASRVPLSKATDMTDGSVERVLSAYCTDRCAAMH